MIKSIVSEFSEYFQYLIALILLFIFYRKFIVKNDVVILGGDITGKKSDQGGANGSSSDLDIPGLTDGSSLEEEFNINTAKGRLKSKVRSQIVNNLEGLDEESAAKYEVLIEEIDKIINNEPAEMAKMIELLLSENSGKKYGNKKR